MLHPWIMEQIANEHQNYLLKEAEAYRIPHQEKKERYVKAGQLKHMVARFRGLLIGLTRKLAD